MTGTYIETMSLKYIDLKSQKIHSKDFRNAKKEVSKGWNG